MADSNDFLYNLNVQGVQAVQGPIQPPNPAPLPNPAPPRPPPPNLPTPKPLPFLGDPTDFARFKLKLTHFFYNHQTSFPTPFTRVMLNLTCPCHVHGEARWQASPCGRLSGSQQNHSKKSISPPPHT